MKAIIPTSLAVIFCTIFSYETASVLPSEHKEATIIETSNGDTKINRSGLEFTVQGSNINTKYSEFSSGVFRFICHFFQMSDQIFFWQFFYRLLDAQVFDFFLYRSELADFDVFGVDHPHNVVFIFNELSLYMFDFYISVFFKVKKYFSYKNNIYSILHQCPYDKSYKNLLY